MTGEFFRDNPTTYVIGDTHFNHGVVAAIRGYQNAEDMNQALVEAWNQTVRPGDIVWHLGDVYFGGQERHEILWQLNGTKHLVLGNHDRYPHACYAAHFNKIYGSMELHGAILTHLPVHPGQAYRWNFNVHGHTHDKVIDDPFYICVSLEQTGGRPVALKELLNRRKA